MNNNDKVYNYITFEALEQLNNIAVKNGLENYEITEDKGSMKGDGYLGIITAVEITGISEGKKKSINLIVKTSIQDNTVRDKMSISDIFSRETYMYSTVIPQLQKFLTKKRLPPIPCFTKWYQNTNTVNNETIIMENLKTAGFVLWERRKPMANKHVAIVLKQYSHLHAISIALKDQDFLQFANIIKNFEDLMAKLIEKLDFVELLVKECKKVLELFNSNESADIYMKFKHFIDEAPEFLLNLRNIPEDGVAIIHGDSWSNNMLFKYDVHVQISWYFFTKMNETAEVFNHISSEILEQLKDIAVRHGFENFKIIESIGSKKGDGYLGIITAVEISGVCNGSKKSLNLIVKSPITGNAIREEVPLSDIFCREIYMYSTVIPYMQKFLTKKNLPPFVGFARWYHSISALNSESIIMENLKTAGFSLWERRKPMNKEHIALVMKQYGRYHAISFALKDQDFAQFANLTKNFDDIMAKIMEKPDFLEMNIKECNKVLELFNSNEFVDVYKKFKNFIGKVSEFLQSLSQLSEDGVAILHGDCWSNNMLFKYDDATNANVPTQVCFIDLQLARLAPPVLDIVYFFYACSSKEVLDDHHYYMELYYNSLADYVREMGSNPDVLYPHSVFIQQWNKYAKFGLLISLIVIKLMLSEQDEVTDFADLAEAGKGMGDALSYDIANSSEYNDRVKHLVLHFVKNKLL